MKKIQALLVGSLMLGACAKDPSFTKPERADTTTVDAPTTTSATTTTTTPAPYLFETSPSEWSVGLVTASRKCFGSAGCSISVEPGLTYVGTRELPDRGTVVVRISVSGDEDGEIIETFEVDTSTGMFQAREIRMSTVNGDVKPSAKVTSAEYHANR